MEPLSSSTDDIVFLKRLAGYSKEQLKGRSLNKDFTLSLENRDDQEVLEQFKKIVTQNYSAILRNPQAAPYLPLAVRRIKYYLSSTFNRELYKEIITIRNTILALLPKQKESEIDYALEFFKDGKCDSCLAFLELTKKSFNGYSPVGLIQTNIQKKSKDFKNISNEDLREFIKSFEYTESVFRLHAIHPSVSLLKDFFKIVVLQNINKILEMPECWPNLNRIAAIYGDYPLSYENPDIYSACLPIDAALEGVFEVVTDGETVTDIKLTSLWERVFKNLFERKHSQSDFLYEYFNKLILNEGAIDIEGFLRLVNNEEFNNRFPSVLFRYVRDLVLKNIHKPLSEVPNLKSLLGNFRSLNSEAVEELVDFIRTRSKDILSFKLLIELYPYFSSNGKFGDLIRNEEMLLSQGDQLPGLIIKSWQMGNREDFNFFVELLNKENRSHFCNWTVLQVINSGDASDECILNILPYVPQNFFEFDLKESPGISCHLLTSIVTQFPNIALINVSLEPSCYNDTVLSNSNGTKVLHINEALLRKHLPKFREFSAEFHDDEFAFLERWLPYILDPKESNLPDIPTDSENGLIEWFRDLYCTEALSLYSSYQEIKQFQETIDELYINRLNAFDVGDVRISKFRQYLMATPGRLFIRYYDTRFYRSLRTRLDANIFTKIDTEYSISNEWKELFLTLHSSLDELSGYLVNYYLSLRDSKKSQFFDILDSLHFHQDYPEFYFYLAADTNILADSFELTFFIKRLCLLNSSAKIKLSKYLTTGIPHQQELSQVIYKLYQNADANFFEPELSKFIKDKKILRENLQFHANLLATSFIKNRHDDFNYFMSCASDYDKEVTDEFFSHFSVSVKNEAFCAGVLKVNNNRNPYISSNFRKILSGKSDVWNVGFVSDEDLLEILKIKISETPKNEKFVLDMKLHPCMTVGILQKLIYHNKDIQFSNFTIHESPLNDLHFTCEGDNNRSFYMNSDVLKLKIPFFEGLLSKGFNPEGNSEIELSVENFDFLMHWLPFILNSEKLDNQPHLVSEDAFIRCFNYLCIADYFLLWDLRKTIDSEYYNAFFGKSTNDLTPYATALGDYLNRRWNNNAPYFEKLNETLFYLLLKRNGLLPYSYFSWNASCAII